AAALPNGRTCSDCRGGLSPPVLPRLNEIRAVIDRPYSCELRIRRFVGQSPAAGWNAFRNGVPYERVAACQKCRSSRIATPFSWWARESCGCAHSGGFVCHGISVFAAECCGESAPDRCSPSRLSAGIYLHCEGKRHHDQSG